MDGTASNTQEVAGAVIRVGQVGRGGVSWGTGDPLLTLRRHQAEAVTPSVSSHISHLRIKSYLCSPNTVKTRILILLVTDVILKLNMRDKD